MDAYHSSFDFCASEQLRGLNGTVATSRPVAAPLFVAPAASATAPMHCTAGRVAAGRCSSGFGASKAAENMLPDLEPLEALTLQKYCGPTPESNWVIPGHLLAGAFPASANDSETMFLLSSILKQGVNKFVCLQEEFRPTGVPEELWRSGQALRPYFDDVKRIVSNWQYFGGAGHRITTLDQLSFVHFPIQDCNVTNDEDVIELAVSLAESLRKGDVLYLHCWGGHGRTGTVVCILLHLLYGLDASASLLRCQRVHDLRECPIDVQSPQTPLQREQVVRVISKLMASAQAAAPMAQSSRSPSAGSVACSDLDSEDEIAASTAEATTDSSDVSVPADSYVDPDAPKPTRYLSFSLPSTFSLFAFLRRTQQADTDMIRVSA